MTASDRSSDRATEPGTNHLATVPHTANSGADGGGQLAVSNWLRVGRGRLAEMGMSLTDRDWAMLSSLDQLHCLTTPQLERLHCPVPAFTPLAAARTARRHLTHLHNQGLVERLARRIGGERMGSASFVYRLSPLGARLLKHPTRRRSREPSLSHLTHVLAVSELVVQLHEVARTDAVELLTVETEPACWRPIVAAHGGQVLLKPDLRVALAVRDRELHWFVEQDNASEHRPVLSRKCEVYLQAWRDGRVTAELGVFPRVLWVVPDEHRAAVMQLVIDQLPGAPVGMFLVTTSDQALTSLSGGDGSSGGHS